jgi:hypothetical protein
VPALQRAFGTVPLSAGDWLVGAVVATTGVAAREIQKAYFRAVDARRALAREPGSEPGSG